MSRRLARRIMHGSLLRTSRFLSLVLRHRPEKIGLTLDDEGWVKVTELLDACRRSGQPISQDEMLTIVETNDKKRFVVRNGRIRGTRFPSSSTWNPCGLQRTSTTAPRNVSCYRFAARVS